MGWNVPDDWGSYYSKCSYCGSRVHASEGGCGCLDDAEKCHTCSNERRPRWAYDNEAQREGYFHIDDLHEIDGKYFCEEHAVCGCCSLGEGGDEDDIAKLKWHEDADDLSCSTCWEEEHYCEAQGPLLDHMAKKVSEPGS